MVFAVGTFFFSLVGITALFSLKEWERRRNQTVVPALRSKADALARRAYELLLALETDVEKLPPELLHLARIGIHKVALSFAALLRILSLQVHRLADLVSHKHAFRRRAPRSEFLKKVLEHKNENGGNPETLDTKY